MKRIFGAFGFVCLSFLALAQQPAVNENPVKVQIQLSPQQIAPGETAELLIDVTVDAGHHAYKDMLKVKWPETDGVLIEKVDVSPVQDFDDPFTKKKREAIEGQSTVKATLRFPDNFPEGVYSKAVKFTYQACSATYCLFPKTIDLPVEFKVAAKNNAIDLTGGSFSSALAHGTLWAYLFVFIAGILTSFTPCIFPMIPITISIIGARSAGTKRSRAFALSVFYVLGISTTYSTLGVVAASTGMLF